MPDLGDLGSIAAAVIALVALIYSGLIHRRQNAQARQQTELQRQLTVIETSHRADELEDRLRADVFVKLGPPTLDSVHAAISRLHLYDVLLMNRGKALAHEVRCDLMPVECSDPLPGDSLEPQPLDLPPGQEVSLTLPRIVTRDRPLRVAVAWVDGTGRQDRMFNL